MAKDDEQQGGEAESEHAHENEAHENQADADQPDADEADADEADQPYGADQDQADQPYEADQDQADQPYEADQDQAYEADQELAYEDQGDDVLHEERAASDRVEVPVSAIMVGAVAVSILTIALLILTWALVDREPSEPGSGTSAAGLVGADRAKKGDERSDIQPELVTSAGAASGSPLDRCGRAARALNDTLSAARPSLDQWAVHVGAMNQLVVGEITLQQASAFWERTRVGARRGVAGFRKQWDALLQEGVDCPRPDLMPANVDSLRPCAQQVRAQVRALRAARTSVDTWDSHVRHMDMMRLGTLSPEKATEMWLSMWQRGVRDLDAYRAAARAAQQAHGCHGLPTG